MVAPAAGGALRNVLGSWDAGHVSRVAWQNGNVLLFLAHEGTGQVIGRVDTRRGAFERLREFDSYIAGELSVSQDGSRAALVADTPRHPAEVFLTHTDAVEPRRLTRSNPWLNETALAPQEVVRFNARDGLALEGILIRPLNQRSGRYPLIVVAHGGPESHYSNGWLTTYSMPGQVGSARGFAVFYPNYRGSTGRGVKFSMLSQGDPMGRHVLFGAVRGRGDVRRDHRLDLEVRDLRHSFRTARSPPSTVAMGELAVLPRAQSDLSRG
jgi:dipeptidyl aminopeptidase/acylaminoacyl peptidase